MLTKMRNIAFWIVDYVKGSKVRKAYNDLKKYSEVDSTSTSLNNYQTNAIKSLIKQATQNTEYYKSYQGETELSLFPVVNKETIRDNQKKFMSNRYNEKDLIKMSTSGSTGTPFISYQNIEKKRRVNAETIYFNSMAGYSVGSKLINLRSLNIKNSKSRIQQWMQNERLIDVDKLEEEDIEKLCSIIEKNTNKSSGTMLSYASTYDALYDYFKKNNLEVINNSKIHGIISTSEILYDETREYMSNAFNCNCYSRYANMENGMLGQDRPSHPNTFILNEANYFFEILKMESNEPAEFGEVGRIVVTDFYNYSMPMIRYDNGDIGSFTYVKVKGKKKKAIANFGGRKIDMVYDVYENYVSPHKISVSFWGFNELKQFQFIQEGKKEYRILLSVNGEFTKKNELEETLRDILGSDATLIFELVKNIPVLNSGKRKYIVNKTL